MASGYFTWGEPGLCVKPSMAYLKQVTMGDFNSFLMLFFDNFSSLIGILGGMISAPMIACQFDFTYFDYFAAFKTMVFSQVCPGIGCALLFGNIWYMMMAAKLSTTTGRVDHTALPYGINTPAGFLTVYMVMLPVCFKCVAPRRAARARSPPPRPRPPAAFARRARPPRAPDTRSTVDAPRSPVYHRS